MTIIDARGLSCPQPVLMTMEALKAAPEVCQVLVDNATAKSNVTRYAQKAGYTVTVSEDNGDYTLELKK